MDTIAGIRRTVFILFETIAIAAFAIMLGSSLLQVFFRYAINAPLMWTEELARLMCVVTTYFGSVGVLIAREHIRVDLIDAFVKGRAASALSLVVDILIAWFMVAIVIGCWLMTSATWTTFTASMSWFRMSYIYIAVGVAAAAMALILLLDIYSRVLDMAGRRKGVEAWS
jgi:TRAP-type C4-dicarboxylate transport system permease small subunit